MLICDKLGPRKTYLLFFINEKFNSWEDTDLAFFIFDATNSYLTAEWNILLDNYCLIVGKCVTERTFNLILTGHKTHAIGISLNTWFYDKGEIDARCLVLSLNQDFTLGDSQSSGFENEFRSMFVLRD